MYLKKIEIAGFKSFAERTVIEFDRGLTAVVGPNGSGKSNITEAIRWVLGEQSAKSLRGGKMPDVIFAGTTKRKALNIAEVTVVLDNEERALPLDFSEVSVTRRLRRTGESDFYINKQSCRLKDIVDLFMDSGLGKESFSIISQGKVEAIFNSKPEDRRGIFEEAAGVLKYKQRKRQAEQKLFETEDNLNRVQDIIYELEAQLEPLAEQSHVAKKYLQLKEQLTTVDVGVTVKEIKDLKQRWQESTVTLKEVNDTLNQVGEAIGEFERSLINLRDKRTKLDEKLDYEQQHLLKVTEAYEQAEGQKNVLLERGKNTTKTSNEYTSNLALIKEKIQVFDEEKRQLLISYKEKEQKLKELEEVVTEIERLVETYSKSAKERLADLRSEYVELMQQRASVSNDLKHLEKQYQQESQKNQTAITRHEQLNARQEKLVIRQKEAEVKLTMQQELLDILRQSYVKTQRESVKQKQDLAIKEKQMYDAMGILQQAKARQKSLQELQENYAGFYQGVRAVLKAKDELTGIVGAVAELIQVPKELALGIETALGGAAQNIVMADEKAARDTIAYLKNKRLGRATLLPLTTIKARVLPNGVRDNASGTPGYIGIASELVTCEPNVKHIVENLLGVTLLARDLRSANELAKKVRYQYRVVSLEGDVMNPGGSMTGGATRKGNQGNLFAQAGELQDLTSQLAKMADELAMREHTVKELKEVVKLGDEEIEEKRNSGELARVTEQDLRHELDLLVTEKDQLARETKVFAHESEELQAFLDDYQEQKEDLTSEMERVQQARDRLDEEMAQADELEASNTIRREEAQETLKNYLAKVAVLKEQITHTSQLKREKEAQINDARRDEERVSEQIRLLTDDSSTQAVSKESVQIQMTDLQNEKQTIVSLLGELKSERESVHHRIGELDEELTFSNKQQQQLLGDKSQAEVLRSRSEVGMDNGLQHLQEDYSLTYEAGSELYPLTTDFEEAKLSIRSLKKEIESLGPVNMGAIEQYESVNERCTFLVEQRDDLLEAKNSLFETMSEMDEIVKAKFEEVFTAIRGKFQRVFPNMFGGGHADLRLTDPSDLLNTGIEIVAQPPGKKLQSLSLLSGGERALTAIALLFSIIQVRPVPFCVLDEVEAALDEANVARFGKYLSSFEDDTQFIVITHRKGTMEAADVLYGVTMQESGISNIVSVRLEDINERGDIEEV